LVVSEDLLAQANALAVDATHIDVDPTGSSGLAGLLALRDQGTVGDHERVGLLFTGIRR
jgi:threonine synthase